MGYNTQGLSRWLTNLMQTISGAELARLRTNANKRAVDNPTGLGIVERYIPKDLAYIIENSEYLDDITREEEAIYETAVLYSIYAQGNLGLKNGKATFGKCLAQIDKEKIILEVSKRREYSNKRAYLRRALQIHKANPDINSTPDFQDILESVYYLLGDKADTLKVLRKWERDYNSTKYKTTETENKD